eukprot:Lithocolla_globosa_v1_NODE_753_length_3331_cov_106.581197.p3 type:complete len:131 gc:universal NODE_753_length_3331_cov_106.581197:1161-769(-)
MDRNVHEKVVDVVSPIDTVNHHSIKAPQEVRHHPGRFPTQEFAQVIFLCEVHEVELSLQRCGRAVDGLQSLLVSWVDLPLLQGDLTQLLYEGMVFQLDQMQVSSRANQLRNSVQISTIREGIRPLSKVLP